MTYAFAPRCRKPGLAHRSFVLVMFIAVLGALPSSSGLAAGAAQQPFQQQGTISGIAPSAMAQLAALEAEKASRTTTENKIASQLLYARKMARGQAIAAGVRSLEVDVPHTSDGRVEIEVRANVNAGLLARLRSIGAEIVEANTTYRSIHVRVDLDRVEAIAALPDVMFVLPRQRAMTFGGFAAGSSPGRAVGPTASMRQRKTQKRVDRAALMATVQRALGNAGPGTATGSQTSQGDATHKAFTARSTYSIDGTGVKIGVLSDGACALAESQATGDLGPVTILPGQVTPANDCTTYPFNEGTAMLEIIHDLAPGAQLYFATAFNGLASFAQNIRDLRAAGCDIIVDDVFYFVESPFQDGQTETVVSQYNSGVVAQAVKDVAADGALYFSSAGNLGSLDQGTSGTWEGNFVSGGTVSFPESGEILDFGGGAGPNYDLLTKASGFIVLFWSDPLGNSTNDYDLFRLNSTGTAVLDASNNTQAGPGWDPIEVLLNPGAAGDRIVVVKHSGTPQFLHLDTLVRGTLSIATSGSTHGHATTSAANSFAVAATAAAGPYPGPFNESNVVEPSSSDGPRHLFFDGDGTVHDQVLNKPDFTAADGVSISGAGGFGNPAASCGAASGKCFSGTSAAAAHAAAIAALVKSVNLSLTASQVTTALISSAIDIHAPGMDRNSGFGIPLADAAIQSLSAHSPTVTTAITNEDTPTTSGLVLSRNIADGGEVTHFKITNILNGTLFQNDGTTAIANDAFITFGQGNAGLKFTPALNFNGVATFAVQAAMSASGVGLGPAAAASIIVSPSADTPSVTSATTNEDTQTTSGLVVSRNAVDGAEVTHFKITGITGGTLFQHDGTTSVVNNAFITVAEGNAGLTFTPTPNGFAPGHFTVQAAVSNIDGGLGGGTVTADVTVNPVADTPSVSNATTTRNTQTTSGLVISRNAVDGSEVTHFKITGISGGTLFQNDGTTPIAINTFITVAQGNAGVKFTPATNSYVVGHFTVQASVSNTDAGLGVGTATADILVVSGFTDDPAIAGATPIRAMHVTELRSRIDALRTRFGRPAFAWTDPNLAGAVLKVVHLTELRAALRSAYDAAIAAGRSVALPEFTDDQPTPQQTTMKAVHITELRSAVVALEIQQ